MALKLFLNYIQLTSLMKNFTLIISIILYSISINSQNSETKFGVKSGINSSKYTPERYIGDLRLADYQGIIGFYIGGFSNIKISKNLKLQPELLYFNQGTKIVIEDITLTDSNGNTIGSGDIESKINESAVSLPVNLQYYVSEKFYFEGGIQLGYIINRKEKITKNPFSQFTTGNNNMDYDKFDFGFNIGLGFSLQENIRVNARTFMGIIERDNSIKPLVLSLGIEYEI